MELQGSVTLPAIPEQVWQALNDPEVLRQCIPGCEEVRQIAPDEMHARVLLKLGPVRASFVGKVRLTDVRPLQGCTLNFEGSGGSAGFAKGSSVIVLTALPEGTRLDYTAQASVAGKLGQIGGRLIDASARQLADRFFSAFKAHITGGQTPGLPALASHVSGALSLADQASPEPRATVTPGWFAFEKARLLWFVAGVASTALGVWIGTHWLR
jgi:carbon monoxide dehydrogenase subunit G